MSRSSITSACDAMLSNAKQYYCDNFNLELLTKVKHGTSIHGKPHTLAYVLV